MRLKRWTIAILGLSSLALLVTGLLGFWLRPSPMPRTEIFKGVFLTVEELSRTGLGSGRAMIVEIHWRTPGVRLEHRDFDYPVHPDDPGTPHFNLTFGDWALWRHRPSVLVNTTRYHPSRYRDSLPGMAVRSGETLVVNSRISHRHEHSYLLYWDEEMRAGALTNKPPDPEILEKARLAIGLQGVQVNGGLPRTNTFADLDLLDDRTFVGIDPEREILFLMAFERASGYLMIDRAVEAGVIFGGQVDSGDGTTLLIGPGARGVPSHSGIRNPRPLGPYLKIIADPLPGNR
ncbi:MAG TPA: hypothetical protein VJ960_05375 [Oceanipulchritudo sp.]|nr:hypothetical protein [Oceanipulchritudo sp.]